ncbi:hypothetical protein HHK36_013905 [Tetracentron sinense]|uniref:Protein FAR1-RELATED SEQUENCE n=1 Tax=Tetracentron sinense TaxID=13715 RepID=A0A835DEV0_TETSI|nr:hypothetical protein HHK36_013905 [Tetracentron sinense]
MEEISLNSEQVLVDDGNESENERDCDTTESDGQNGVIQVKKESVTPAVGLEFESYDDAYDYYNFYAKEMGFGIRVKSSCFRRNNKEKYGAILCCSSEGFKKKREAPHQKAETRTGCPAMIRVRLMEYKRWRVVEVKLEHNHLTNPDSAQFCKSHKNLGSGTKRKLQSDCDAEVRTIKLYQTLLTDAGGDGSSTFDENYARNYIDQSKQLKLKKGDIQAIHNYFCRMQLKNPSFLYLMDLNDDGCLRNVFWADARSRAAYGYFGDVVAFDSTFLSNKYEIPLVGFVGLNHHGQSVLLGCGLVAGETTESYIWLFRAWLTCMSGRPPQAIITDRCKALQNVIAEVFPRARHCYCSSLIMQKVPEKLGGLNECDAIKRALSKALYDTLKVDEFETAWEDMITRYGVRDHEWLQTLYAERERWVPVFLKDTFFAGMSATGQIETMNAIFDGDVHKLSSLKDFFDKYEPALQKKHDKEALADCESRNSSPALKTRCYFELQLSKLYTSEIFKRFQYEVEEMHSCFSTTQVQVDEPIITFMVKERVPGKGNGRDFRNYEVLYDKVGMEVRCICNCFNFKGYLCRHALCVLNYNGVEEIPFQYILSRWRKNFKRIYVTDHGSNSIDVMNPVQLYDHLYRRALQIVEEAVISQDHYKVALQVFEESLNKADLGGLRRIILALAEIRMTCMAVSNVTRTCGSPGQVKLAEPRVKHLVYRAQLPCRLVIGRNGKSEPSLNRKA